MSDFDVMDMLDDYAAENNVDVEDIFKKTEPEAKATAPVEQPVKAEQPAEPAKQSEVWAPDADLIADMPELNRTEMGVEIDPDTYDKIPEIINGADEEVKNNGANEVAEIDAKTRNIEEAKARHHISKLTIPPGQWQVNIMLAASAEDHDVAQQKLDEIFDTIEKSYPQWIIERTEGYVAPPEESAVFTNDPDLDLNEDSDRLKVVIDKRQVSDFAWSEEEIEKIKKARIVELNIVDGKDIDFGSITDVDDNAVDTVLSKFKRVTHDVTGVLPASKYRATFSGLSYPESIDLITAGELNTFDSKMKMLTLAFNHIHNQSIGPWEEYREYYDPNTGKLVKIGIYDKLPDGIDPKTTFVVTKFMDFMRKTSYLDLDFIIWKILCASSLESELITITCRATKDNGQPCNKSYDWIYKPAHLLNTESINQGVLDDMKEAGEAGTAEDIQKAYKSSMVAGNNYVVLNSCGLYLVYGHANAFEYMNDMFSRIEENLKAATAENASDPSIVTRAMIYTAVPVIKGFLVPQENGGFKRIVGVDNIIKVLETLDEIDWGTVTEIHNLVTKPYEFEYVMKDVVCPECHNKSDIRLSGVDRLLFIRAQTLRSVQVKLTKN